MASNDRQVLSTLIKKKLLEINVDINGKQLSYDTEENCTKSNNGNWAKRLA